MFKVIDRTTGKEPDLAEIALREDWADGLTRFDMEGFAVTEDGSLVLLDECGQYRCCPQNRFDVVWGNAEGDRTNRTITGAQARIAQSTEPIAQRNCSHIGGWRICIQCKRLTWETVNGLCFRCRPSLRRVTE